MKLTPQEPDTINNYEDYLDSRDIQERIDWLQSIEEDDGKSEELITIAEKVELEALLKLKEQYVNDYGDSSWGYGAQFIRESYFQDYAQELAEDIGAIKEGLGWPNNCIDWEQAARELAMDYSEVDFDGITYYTREA